MAYDGMNNIFNLAYEILAWKIHRALIEAKLEPYLGFLHSNQMGKLSLVCDFQELYRYLIDDFLIQYCQRICKKDFTVKTENANRKRKGKREYRARWLVPKLVLNGLNSLYMIWGQFRALQKPLIFLQKTPFSTLHKQAVYRNT
jgi:CRISPR/Cas system-associated endonuclease Cas1